MTRTGSGRILGMAPVEGARARADIDDGEVIRRVLAGETALYEILMRRYNQRLYRAVRSIVPDETEVEDILQDAYLSAFHNLASFAGRSSFSTWLVRIGVNKSLDRRRRSGTVVTLEAVEPGRAHEQSALRPLATAASSPEKESSSLELAALLSRAIDTLPDVYRCVYVLREIEDMSTREVAECLSLEPGTVKTRLHRARVLLRDWLFRTTGESARHTFQFGGDRCNALVARVLQTLARA